MLDQSQPCDRAIHETARRMAGRFVWVISALLREEEKIDALREAYLIAREELETFQSKELAKPCEKQP
jgi:hypothetical protein